MAIKGRLCIILCEWGYVYALVGRPNERKGMINNPASEFGFAAPLHDPPTPSAVTTPPIVPPVDPFLTLSPYPRQIFPPSFPKVQTLQLNNLLCHSLAGDGCRPAHCFALLECPDWRDTQSGSLVKRMQFKSYIFSDGLSGCDLTPVAHHCDPTPFCVWWTAMLPQLPRTVHVNKVLLHTALYNIRVWLEDDLDPDVFEQKETDDKSDLWKHTKLTLKRKGIKILQENIGKTSLWFYAFCKQLHIFRCPYIQSMRKINLLFKSHLVSHRSSFL